MTKRYIRDQWEAARAAAVEPGDYVLATKYFDGDPADQFCVGIYDRQFEVDG